MLGSLLLGKLLLLWCGHLLLHHRILRSLHSLTLNRRRLRSLLLRSLRLESSLLPSLRLESSLLLSVLQILLTKSYLLLNTLLRRARGLLSVLALKRISSSRRLCCALGL